MGFTREHSIGEFLGSLCKGVWTPRQTNSRVKHESHGTTSGLKSGSNAQVTFGLVITEETPSAVHRVVAWLHSSAAATLSPCIHAQQHTQAETEALSCCATRGKGGGAVLVPRHAPRMFGYLRVSIATPSPLDTRSKSRPQRQAETESRLSSASFYRPHAMTHTSKKKHHLWNLWLWHKTSRTWK